MAPGEPLLFCLLPLVVAASFKDTYENFRGPKVDFYMRTTWDGQKIDHDPIKLTIGRVNATETVVFVQAPYFEGLPAKGYEDTESIQLYFLGADRESYLLIEVNPHSQYRVQLYRGPGNSIRDQLPLEYWSVITGKFWQGSLRIPEAYYPPGMSRFNAYAQHQHGDNTTYEALFPVPKDKPQQFPQMWVDDARTTAILGSFNT
ncbi:conserved hypothetical protein [Ixodes scapularis]|uniref:Uncharacterized protein n=1 Tax=Ixodes scapularis TaxID=6945 RepID=B7P2F1_IXOSC|nr:conserved hypothetical protein [Ixodes scapularis]|eukprot:XP_002402243.1 conserved hypothetical protein [Ixodes scapularis]